MRSTIRRLFFVFLVFFPLILPGQTTANIDLPSLESPYSTMYTHLYFLQADSYEPALSAKVFYNLSDTTKAMKLAIQLKQVLDGQGLFVHLETLPTNNDYIDSTSHKPYFTPFPMELPEVYLEKINNRWYYSRETAALISQLHQKVFPFGSDILINLFPKIGQQEFLGLALWQYLGILILLLMAWLVHLFLSRIINPLIKSLSHHYLKDAGVHTGQVWNAARLLSILLIVYLLRLMVPALLLPIQLSEWIHKGLSIFATVIFVLFLLRVLELVMIYFRSFAEGTDKKYDEQLIPILHTIAKIVVVTGGIFQVLQLLDVNVTTLIAGISIGGLALALAAQDTVKNFIGSAMIFADRPFQIGDFIEWSGQSGTVMEVGFRTTRIKTSDTSIISVPNGTIANAAVTNKGMRVFRLFMLQLAVTYDTSPTQIEQFLEGLRELVRRHPETHDEDVYIHLNNLNNSSIDILFRVFLQVPGFAGELQAKEELLFGIIKLADLLGISFAFPSTSVYVEKIPTSSEVDADTLNEQVSSKEKMQAFLEDFERKMARDS